MASGGTPIRSSLLASYIDCSRRSFAKGYTEEVIATGYDLTPLAPSAGAALGTACHYASELMAQVKIDTGEFGSIDIAIDAAVEKFGEEISPGVIWDETTPNRNSAMIQLTRQVKAYYPILITLDPLAVELALKADLGDGFELSGHIDIIEKNGTIRDEKFGAMDRPYQPQMGAYSLLARSNNYPAKKLVIDWVPRTGKTKFQEPAVTKEYDQQESEQSALGMIARVKSDIRAFRADPDDLWKCLPANPMSLICSEKYCPAYNTNFCDAWKYKA